jgi:sugar/nucleoside kinase (ribokinase family)
MPVWLLDDVSLVLVSGYSYFADVPRSAIAWLAEEAHSRGIGLAVDAASVGFIEEVGAENFVAWTRGVSVLFCNRAEALALSGSDELDTQMRMLGRTAERAVIKLGPDGAALGGAGGITCRLPAPQVEVVDTTGAGDAFAAAFITAELGGAGEEVALAAGIAAGSAAVGKIGGQPG